MRTSHNFRARLEKLQEYFGAKKSVVVRAVFGENGEFGSVKFRRQGTKTEVLEMCEPDPIEGDSVEADGETDTSTAD